MDDISINFFNILKSKWILIFNFPVKRNLSHICGCNFSGKIAL